MGNTSRAIDPTRTIRTHRARWIVTVVAIGLAALALALAAPASAKGSQHGGGPAHHTSSTAGSHPGHDKCRKTKGDRGYPPWCTDPSAGWMSSTLHKAEQPTPALSALPPAAMSTAPVTRRGGLA